MRFDLIDFFGFENEFFFSKMIPGLLILSFGKFNFLFVKVDGVFLIFLSPVIALDFLLLVFFKYVGLWPSSKFLSSSAERLNSLGIVNFF